jgi:hypothetical protein
MRRWLNNLPILAKAFAAPGLLLLCLIVISARSYVVIDETAAGLTALSQSSLPKRGAVGALTRSLSDAQVLLLRYVSWLNSGVDKDRLRAAEREIAERNQAVSGNIVAIMSRSDLQGRERLMLEKIKTEWARYQELARNSIEMGAVQPSMAVCRQYGLDHRGDPQCRNAVERHGGRGRGAGCGNERDRRQRRLGQRQRSGSLGKAVATDRSRQ